jgi:hypothetical protein
MKITSRLTHSYIDIRTDELKTSIFRDNKNEIDEMIYDLLNICDDLTKYTDKSITDYVKDLGFNI